MSVSMMDLFEIYVLEHPDEEQRTKVDIIQGENDPNVWVQGETLIRFMNWLVKHKHISKAYRDNLVAAIKKVEARAKAEK